ncbi:hypothetical protein [Nostoc sp. ChiVER01]|uniref:hypothetical protein n=1 Tax=Nostoc sp. ChiVER01 TaxID=3075382 RepID=UPI002AD341A2|nr:hypothetical protein [Nostoc sp. ChiVER01]MDZ8225768.1 hypothetical protein [Nostoc sp. ChiVER01]
MTEALSDIPAIAPHRRRHRTFFPDLTKSRCFRSGRGQPVALMLLHDQYFSVKGEREKGKGLNLPFPFAL